MVLSGGLAGTDRRASAAALTERLVDRGDPLDIKKINGRVGANLNA